MASKLPPADAMAADNVVLSWKYPDGSVASGHHERGHEGEEGQERGQGHEGDQAHSVRRAPRDLGRCVCISGSEDAAHLRSEPRVGARVSHRDREVAAHSGQPPLHGHPPASSDA